MAWAATVPTLGVIAAPLTLAVGPVASFNVLTAAALPVSAWAAFVLCRRLTGKFWPALVGGAVFGFSAYEMNHYGAGQINLAYTILLPILGYLVLLWREESISSATFVALAGLAMAMQFYLFLETFADLTAILVISLGLGAALAGRDLRPAVLRLARLVGVAYMIAIVLAAPYIWYALTTAPPKPPKMTSLDLASLVVPNSERTYGIAWLAHAAAGPHPESAWRLRRGPAASARLLLAVTTGPAGSSGSCPACWSLSWWPRSGPCSTWKGASSPDCPGPACYDLPIVRNAWPSRLMLFAFLALAVATALWLARPRQPDVVDTLAASRFWSSLPSP